MILAFTGAVTSLAETALPSSRSSYFSVGQLLLLTSAPDKISQLNCVPNYQAPLRPDHEQEFLKARRHKILQIENAIDTELMFLELKTDARETQNLSTEVAVIGAAPLAAYGVVVYGAAGILTVLELTPAQMAATATTLVVGSAILGVEVRSNDLSKGLSSKEFTAMQTNPDAQKFSHLANQVSGKNCSMAGLRDEAMRMREQAYQELSGSRWIYDLENGFRGGRKSSDITGRLYLSAVLNRIALQLELNQLQYDYWSAY